VSCPIHWLTKLTGLLPNPNVLTGDAWLNSLKIKFGDTSFKYPTRDYLKPLLHDVDPQYLDDWKKKFPNWREECVVMVPFHKDTSTARSSEEIIDTVYQFMLAIISMKIHIARMLAPPGGRTSSLVVHGLNYMQTTELKRRKVIASCDHVYFFFPLDHHQNKTFVGYLKGFTGLQNPGYELSEAETRELVINKLLPPNPEALADLFRRNESVFAMDFYDHVLPTGLQPDALLEEFCKSILVNYYARTIKSGLSSIWVRVYASTPEQLQHPERAFVWHQTIEDFRRIKVKTLLNGEASFVTENGCKYCSGHDHPSGLCPYPMDPLWHGPKPETTLATTSTPNSSNIPLPTHNNKKWGPPGNNNTNNGRHSMSGPQRNKGKF
jgi:hypothetical protein